MSRDMYDVLVVGAGITGMQAALDLGDQGYRVVLVDKQSSIGGTMVRLDKTFPTNDCSICIAAPKMVEVARHPNIDLLTYAQIEQVEGSAGNFDVTVWKRSGYVDPEKCTGCGDCASVCPVEVDDTFNARLNRRKGIYIEFPQAVPAIYTIDFANCVGCGACDRVCGPGAISFLQTSREVRLSVGSIIVSTGFDVLEPLELRKEYGYGRYANVLTAIQYERLLSASGPTGGKIVRPSDGRPPQRIAWVQCVGSRSTQHGHPYCSRICCMYATKEATITREHSPETQTTIFYMDLRAYGKDFQQYYQQAARKGVRYIRGRPAAVRELPDGTLALSYPNTLTGEVSEEIFDMVVLSTAVVPAPDNPRLAGVLGIEVDEHGFFGQPDPLRDPLHTTRPGVFVAGGAQGPLDIPDSVAQASGAAGRAAAPLAGRPRHTERPQVAERAAASDAPRTGVFVCSCGKNIGGYVDVPEVATSAESMPHVVASDTYLFACSEDAQRRIREAIEAHDLNRVVLAACSPITHAAVFQQTCEEAGINANLFEMANIRNQCSWVHSDRRDLATAKARDMVRMAVARAAHLRPLPRQEIDVTPAALVIGGGIAGMRAALRLGGMGIDTVLVEREATLGGRLNDLYTLFPADIPARDVLDPLHSEVEQCPHLRVLLEHEVRHVAGYVGNFEVTVDARDGSSSITLTAGSIIVATGAQEIDLSGRYGYGAHPNVITQTELEQRLRDGTLGAPQTVVMLNCAGSMEPENPSCCRVGCGVSVKNMRHIRQAAPQASLYLLYQDLRMFGTRDEQYFTGMVEQARPTLVRYQAEQRPQVTVAADGSLRVRVYDVLLREEHEIAADLVVLTAATRGDADTSRLKQILKVCTNDEDFYSEAHAKIRPLDFATDGIYLCGTSQAPKNVPDSLAQAEGAAARAAIPLLRGSVAVEPSIAEIDPARCTGCGICEPLCPYHAISLDDSQRVATITGVMCKGCGTCVAACPSAAAQQRNFTDEQLTAMLAAAWEWEEDPA